MGTHVIHSGLTLNGNAMMTAKWYSLYAYEHAEQEQLME